jgi:hypothetical protein
MGRVEILAHRGWWDRPEARNTLPALRRAFDAGLGVETDVRDCAGEILISHDPPAAAACVRFRDMLAAYAQAGRPGALALNVKADGLQPIVKGLLREFDIQSYFMFDMSIPDTLQWLNAGVRVFVRQSEYEPTPALYDQAAGVWIDGFKGDWYSRDVIGGHLTAGKQVAVVSPEIHGRDPAAVWTVMKSVNREGLWLCTDRVAEARRFFHGQD